ncbi:uncharacterized protein LOC120710479 [Panicum virgatum]|uniref:uncharacterized protein LOC120710479 n=1 Tax=Panicum virgatum TaxID=38727 RepID=UPI0019D6950F|nr:uncharacterized protein LOC120710479 [Panicum virgatum]
MKGMIQPVKNIGVTMYSLATENDDILNNIADKDVSEGGTTKIIEQKLLHEAEYAHSRDWTPSFGHKHTEVTMYSLASENDDIMKNRANKEAMSEEGPVKNVEQSFLHEAEYAHSREWTPSFGHKHTQDETTDSETATYNNNWREDIFNQMRVDNVEIDTGSGCTGINIGGAKSNTETENDADTTRGSQELTEEEIEDFIRSEQKAAAEGNNADTESKYTPQIGMEFKDRNAAHHFFSFYGFIAGFEVVTTHTARTTHKKGKVKISRWK